MHATIAFCLMMVGGPVAPELEIRDVPLKDDLFTLNLIQDIEWTQRVKVKPLPRVPTLDTRDQRTVADEAKNIARKVYSADRSQRGSKAASGDAHGANRSGCGGPRPYDGSDASHAWRGVRSRRRAKSPLRICWRLVQSSGQRFCGRANNSNDGGQRSDGGPSIAVNVGNHEKRQSVHRHGSAFQSLPEHFGGHAEAIFRLPTAQRLQPVDGTLHDPHQQWHGQHVFKQRSACIAAAAIQSADGRANPGSAKLSRKSSGRTHTRRRCARRRRHGQPQRLSVLFYSLSRYAEMNRLRANRPAIAISAA